MSIDMVGHVAAPQTTGAVRETVKAQHTAPVLDTTPPEAFQNLQKVNGEIQRVVDDLMRMSHSLNRRLDFHVNEETNQVIVRIVDSDSGEVIKQVPPDALLRLHARIQEAVGLLFDETI